jgi:ATP-dependent RNA helicase DDX1
MSQCLIFCRTNLDCDNLEKFLCAAEGGGGGGAGKAFTERTETGKQSKYSCCVLAGMRSLDQRRRSLEAFREGDVRFMICTDVAARGIDIQNLPYVINMTLPDEPEQYIHRIGRVGRAEKMGLAISIVAGEGIAEKVWYHTCSNRGAGCSNRELKERGGCTIWYDEPQYLSNIEKRLDMKIPELLPDYSLPPEIAELGAVYGEDAVRSDADSAVKRHVELLRPAVQDLGAMETAAQNLFLSYSLRFRSREAVGQRAPYAAPAEAKVSAVATVGQTDSRKHNKGKAKR